MSTQKVQMQLLDESGNVISDVIPITDGTAVTVTKDGVSVTLQSYLESLVLQKGDKGDKGDTGATGAAATITVGTVTTGAAGSSAAVINAGTASAAKFNFTIPQGAKGDKGDTGGTGPAGAKGDKGDPGDKVKFGKTLASASEISLFFKQVE